MLDLQLAWKAHKPYYFSILKVTEVVNYILEIQIILDIQIYLCVQTIHRLHKNSHEIVHA